MKTRMKARLKKKLSQAHTLLLEKPHTPRGIMRDYYSWKKYLKRKFPEDIVFEVGWDKLFDDEDKDSKEDTPSTPLG